MDARVYAELKQHVTDILGAALDALGQDYNAGLSGRTLYDAAGLSIKTGGASPQFQTANKIRYGISGFLYALQQQAALSLTQTSPVVPVNSSVAFLVQIDASGVITTKMGSIASGANCSPPSSPDLLRAPIGLIWVQTNGSTTFTPGSTNLDAAGLTVEYIDFKCLESGLGSYPRLPTAPFTSASTLDGAAGPTPPVFNPQNV